MTADGGDRFQAILAGSVLGMAVLGDDGRFLEVNESLCALLGRSAHELTSLTWSDVTHPQDRADGRAGEAQLRAGVQEDLPARQRLLRPDGQVRYADVCKVLIRAASDEQPIVVCQVVDISERVALKMRHWMLAESPAGVALTDAGHAAPEPHPPSSGARARVQRRRSANQCSSWSIPRSPRPCAAPRPPPRRRVAPGTRSRCSQGPRG